MTQIDDISEIISKAKILHLGLFDDEYPYVVPLHYGYEYAAGSFVFYMHCAKVGHKKNLIGRCPNCCVEMECDVGLVSGGDVPCGYGATYASVIGRGRAEIVSAVPEKIRGLTLLMKNQTGRDFEIDDDMASGVDVIKVVVPQFTAKARKD